MTGFNNPVGAVSISGGVDINNTGTVASAISNVGVPNILLQDLILQTTVVPGSGFVGYAVGFTQTINTTKYTSLVIELFNSQYNFTAGGCTVKLDFLDSTGAILYTDFISRIDAFGGYSWEVPLIGASVRLTVMGPNFVCINVYGTNRPVSELKMLGQSTMSRRLQFNGATTVGTLVAVPASDNGPNYTFFNGPISMRITTSVIAGFVGFQHYDQNGVLRQFFVGSYAAGVNAWITTATPRVPVQWVVSPTNAATGFVALEITGAS